MTERRAGRLRIRHYTSRGRMDRIESEGVIRTGAHGAVFCESARRAARAPHDVEAHYRIARGRGRDYVEVNVPRDWIEPRVNPVTGVVEWLISRDVPLDATARIVRRN